MSKEYHSKDKLVFYNAAVIPNFAALGDPKKYPEWIIPGLNVERAIEKWKKYKI